MRPANSPWCARRLGARRALHDREPRPAGSRGQWDELPYADDREIEDIAALIDAVGGRVPLYGRPSGATLVLPAVACLAVDGFVRHALPFPPDDQSSQDGAQTFAMSIRGLLAAGERAEGCTCGAAAPECPGGGRLGAVIAPWEGLVVLAPTLACGLTSERYGVRRRRRRRIQAQQWPVPTG